MRVLLLFLSVMALSYVLVASLIGWARQGRLLDIPNQRSSHTTPTPRGGGLIIGVLTLGGCALYAIRNADQSINPMLAFVVCGLIVMIVGFVDDARNLPLSQRLVVQVSVAVVFVALVGSWRFIDIPFLGIIDTGWLGPILTVLWLTGLINAFNFMDGIDGIAGGVSIIAAIGWFQITTGQPLAEFTRVTGILIVGSSLGFLVHNWSPARIFMGDAGSTFLGFAFGALPLVLEPQNPRLPVAAALLVWPFLFDTLLTILLRLKRRENILAAHRSHLYQQLVILGYGHQRVSLLYIAFASIGFLTAWLWIEEAPSTPIIIVILLPLLWLSYMSIVVVKTHYKSKRKKLS